MPVEELIDHVERLAHAREKLAFVYDSFSQADFFEFSTLDGNSGLTLILLELIEELMTIEKNICDIWKEQ